MTMEQIHRWMYTWQSREAELDQELEALRISQLCQTCHRDRW